MIRQNHVGGVLVLDKNRNALIAGEQRVDPVGERLIHQRDADSDRRCHEWCYL